MAGRPVNSGKLMAPETPPRKLPDEKPDEQYVTRRVKTMNGSNTLSDCCGGNTEGPAATKHARIRAAIFELDRVIENGNQLVRQIAGENISDPKNEAPLPPCPPLLEFLNNSDGMLGERTERLNKIFAELRELLF